MSEKETVLVFSKAIQSSSPKNKSDAQKYMVSLGVRTEKGNLKKNYQTVCAKDCKLIKL